MAVHEDAHLRAAYGGADQRLLRDLHVAFVEPRVQVVGEVRDARAQVVVEAGPDALLGDSADHGGEHAQDPERQRGGDDGQLEADREAGPHGSLTT